MCVSLNSLFHKMILRGQLTIKYLISLNVNRCTHFAYFSKATTDHQIFQLMVRFMNVDYIKLETTDKDSI